VKRAAGIAAVVGVVLLTLGGLARLWVQASLAPLGGRERLGGLSGRVTVLWDSLAVPHVLASSDGDAFAALGYLHARDRGWQLELLRHAALGRLSELMGPATLSADRALRELEMLAIARSRVARASPESRRALAAYARGVNAWLAAGPRALELRLLGHHPEPWQPVHSIAIGLLQAWDLRTTGDEIELAAAAVDLGVERALELLPAEGRGAASNAWAIAGARTRSGKPILANDPHLVLRAPAIWYLAGVHAPGYHVVGATIPGLPAVVLGHTPHVAWGFTNAMVDDVDYVEEELHGDSSRYRVAGGWAPLQVVAETIRVRGGDPVGYRRYRTGRGPLLAAPRLAPNRAYSLRWVAQDGGADELAALHGMARAREWDEFEAALALFGSPEPNVVYADARGTIAYRLAGRVPRRHRGASPFTIPGAALAGDPWTGWLEARALPREVNPARGWIATANNRMVPPDYPHFLSRHYDLPYRARRIGELLERDTTATVASVSSHQMDLVDLFGRAVRGLAARAALAVGRADLADRLRGWDGRMRSDAAEPALYWRWYRELRALVYADESPDYDPAAPLHRWIARGESAWFDDARTPEIETLDTLAQRAMETVLAARGVVPWRTVHHTVLDHPLARVPLLGRLLRFAVGPLETGGSNHTVNNSTTLGAAPPYVSSYGPSLRHVVDFGDPDGAGGFILPGGQAGHSLSAHYRDQTRRWLAGELWVIPLDPARVRAVDTLFLDAPGPRGKESSRQEISRREKPPRVSPGGPHLPDIVRPRTRCGQANFSRRGIQKPHALWKGAGA
jgi:penicillin amidase